MWSKMYLRSNIRKRNNVFIAEIWWSWFGLQHHSELELFDTIEEAKTWILEQRTGGTLKYEIEPIV